MHVLDHPEWQALLATIRANPDDDTPRLVAADWLQEQGYVEQADSLRELVVKDRAARPDKSFAYTSWCGLVAWPEEYDLPRIDPGEGGYHVRRGLAEYVECPEEWWLEHGPAVVRHPLACVVGVKVLGKFADESDRNVLLPVRWYIGRPGRRREQWEVAAVLYHRLGGVLDRRKGGRRKLYAHIFDAYRDLFQVALEWAQAARGPWRGSRGKAAAVR